MPYEAWIALGGIAVTVISLVGAALWKFWEKIGQRFEQNDAKFQLKEVAVVQDANLREQLARIEGLTKSTLDYVSGHMPSALEDACLKGVSAGVSLAKETFQMIHIKGPRHDDNF